MVTNELESSQESGLFERLQAAGLDAEEIAVAGTIADYIARRRRTAAEVIALAESDEAAELVAEFIQKKQEWEARCSAAAARRRALRTGRLVPFKPKKS